MNLLPSIAFASSNIADCFTKPLPTTTHQQLVTLIGAAPTVDPLALANPTSSTVATAPTVAMVPTVVASAPTATSDSVPHPVPYFVDAGASLPVAPSYLDLLLVTQAPFGLIWSAASVAYSSTSKATTSTLSNDPYTLITGENTASLVDLSSSDLFDSDSDSEIASAFEVLEVREFGTATLIFISYPHSELKPTVLLEPIFDHFGWLDWIPLPRLILPESYFHIFGLDYSQAFALFHLIPIWIALVLALLRSE